VIVLGLDTSTPSTVVALRLADARVLQSRDDPPTGAHPGHATRLLAMVDELLTQAGVPWAAIDRIAVGVGPGTFTGLRVGVATARGLAQSLSTEVVGVSSLMALALAALAAQRADGDDASMVDAGAVLAVIDARRGEVFAAAYEMGDAGVPVELTVPRALAPRALAGLVGEAEESAGTPIGRPLAIGDGAVRHRGVLAPDALRLVPDASPLHLVNPAAICELGALAAAAGFQQLLPDYRRRPDAEIALGAAGTAKGL
jgi:tRNA threonylcarbamoyladenosine biosynthesis protein TsaB